MAPQLAFFYFSHTTTAMPSLMGKGHILNWLPEQAFKFRALKTLPTKHLQTNHFASSHSAHMLTDASRHFGLGFAFGSI